MTQYKLSKALVRNLLTKHYDGQIATETVEYIRTQGVDVLEKLIEASVGEYEEYRDLCSSYHVPPYKRLHVAPVDEAFRKLFKALKHIGASEVVDYDES